MSGRFSPFLSKSPAMSIPNSLEIPAPLSQARALGLGRSRSDTTELGRWEMNLRTGPCTAVEGAFITHAVAVSPPRAVEAVRDVGAFVARRLSQTEGGPGRHLQGR